MKSIKNLLIPAIILIILILATIIWLIFKPNDRIVEDVNLDVLTVYINDVAEIDVNKRDDEDFSIILSKENDNISFELQSALLSSNVNYSQDKMRSWVSIMLSYKANSLIGENITNLSEYGLDNPKYVVNIKMIDGTTHKVSIGNDTYDKAFVYVMFDDNNNVYTIANIKGLNASFNPIDFIDSSVFKLDYKNIQTVRFERSTDGYSLTATCSVNDTGEPEYYIVSPFEIKSSSTFAHIINNAAKLDIGKYLELSDEQISSYGLDNPTFHFNFTMLDGEVFDLYLTSNIGGFFYGYTNIVEGYFSLSSMQFDGLETPILLLINDYINQIGVSVVKSIDFESEDISFNYEVSASEGFDGVNTTATLDGRNAMITSSSHRNYGAVLFETLALINIAGVELDVNPEFNPVIHIEYNYTNYTKSTYDFVVRDANNYYVFCDGEYTGFYVNISEFTKDGGVDTYEYGVIPAYHLLETAMLKNVNGIYDIPVDEE